MRKNYKGSVRKKAVSLVLTAAMAAQALLPYQSMASETGVSTELMTELAKAQTETPEVSVDPAEETTPATETVPDTIPETMPETQPATEPVQEESAPITEAETTADEETSEIPDMESEQETTPSNSEEPTTGETSSEPETAPETDPSVSEEQETAPEETEPETEEEADQPFLIWENDTYRITVSPADGGEFPAGYSFDACMLDDLGYSAEEQNALYEEFLASALAEASKVLEYPEDWAESDAAKDAVLNFEPFFMNVIRTDGSQTHGEYFYEIQVTDPALLDSYLQGTSEIHVFEYDDNLEAGMVEDYSIYPSDTNDGLLLSFLSEDEVAAFCVFDAEKLHAEPQEETVPETEAESEIMTEMESETESETETETEAEFVSFSYEDDTVSVTATADASTGIPADAVLKADALEEGSDAYNEAMATVAESLELAEGQEFRFAPYDVYFEYEGERIEPQDGNVHIEMEFKEPIFQEEDDVEPAESFVSHIKDNGEVEHLKNTAQEEQEVVFDVVSFSVMGPVEIMPLADDTEAYAILYADGTMVFQRGSTPDPSRGEMVESYTGFETGYPSGPSAIPWHPERSNIKSVIVKDEIRPSSMSYWFEDCVNLIECDLSNLNTDSVTRMINLFSGCESLTELDLSSFNMVGRYVNVNNMFYICNSLQKIVLGEECSMSSVVALPGEWWRRSSTNELYSKNDLVSSFDGPTMADTYLRDDAYAILYANGTMVFQRGNEIDTSMGEVVDVYTGLEQSSFNNSSSFAKSRWWNQRQNIQSVIIKDLIQPISTRCWFDGLDNMVSCDLSNLDVSKVTSMRSMFGGCESLINIIFPDVFDTSNVTDMSYMFSSCQSLTNLDLPETFSTINVTDMEHMFSDCRSLLELKLPELFDTSNVLFMNNMFDGCRNVVDITLPNVFTAEKVTNMSSMFYQCSSLTSLDLSMFNTGNVTDMSYMFYSCSSLSSLDLSSFSTGNVTDMNSMFLYCSLLTNLDLSSFNTENVTDMSYMFSECHSLPSLDLSSFSTRNVTYMSNMFSGCSLLTALDLSSFSTRNVINMSSMFSSCSSLSSLDLSGFDTVNVTDMSKTFNGCSSLSSLDLSGFNTVNVTDMSETFSGCSSLSSLDLSGFNTVNVTDMSETFNGCSSLSSLDLSGFNTVNVTDMSETFNGCTSLSSLDLSRFNTVNVADMYRMFYDCENLEEVILSEKFNTSNVKDMGYMFAYCDNLATLNLPQTFDTSNVTDMSYMFAYCYALTDLTLPETFDTSKVEDMQRMFRSCGLTTLFLPDAFSTENVSNMTDIFLYSDDLNLIRLGNNFKFITDPDLTETEWMRLSSYDVFTTDELWQNYDGATMSGLYGRKINTNLNGGKLNYDGFELYMGMEIYDPSILTTAQKVHASFDGWYTAAVGGEKLEAGSTVSQMTYYAHYIDDPYTLILKANGPKAVDIEIGLDYTETYQLSDQAFVYDGYVLTGWNTRRNGAGTGYDANEAVLGLCDEKNGTIILYAQWTPKTEFATVSFDSQSGMEIDPITVKKGTTLTADDVPESVRENYTFHAWRIGSIDGPDLTAGESPSFTVEEDITLYAHWVKDPIVTFITGIGDPVQKRVKYCASLGETPSFSPNAKNYMTLIGWFDELTGGTQYSSTTMIPSDTTLYAHWGWAPKFNTNGGRFVEDTNPPIQEDANYTITLPEVERDGYHLTGWFLADGITPVNDGDVVNLSKGIEIVAHWERSDTITVTLDYNDGSGTIETLEVYTDSNLVGLPQLTRSGYTFYGWADEDGNYYDGNNTAGSDDLSLIAQWGENTCTITFDPGNGTINYSSSTKKVPVGSTIQTLPGARLNQYILEGWYTEEDGQGDKLTTETVITESKKYYAYYVPFLNSNEDTTYAYTFGAEWSNASNENVDNLNNNLEFHPTTKTNQTATLHVRFELSDAIGDTEDIKLPVGAVKIRIPKYVWKDWDGENTGTNNLSANLPEWPDIRNGMFFSYMEDGDDYVLINSVELYGGAGVDVSVSYTVDPSNVPGGAKDVNGNYVEGYNYYKGIVPVTVTVDNDGDDIPETTENKELTLEMHTSLQLDVDKTDPSVSYSWNSSWGDEPTDAEDYFYITWRVTESASYRIQASTTSPSEDTVHDGSFVCWGDGRLENPSYDWAPLSGSGVSQHHNYVTMKYPISLLNDIPEEGLTLTNEVILNVTWKSGYKEAKRASASITLYDSEYPNGEFTKRNTNPYNQVETRPGGQEDILDDNDNVELGWYLIYDGSSRNTPISWDEETQTYHAESRTIVMTDGEPGDVMYSSGLPSAKYVWEPEGGNIPLMDSDYRFYKLDILLTEYDTRQKDGVWSGWFTHEAASDYEGIDIYLRYQNTEEFVFYKTVYATSSSRSTTVDLPDNVVGYQLRHRTSYYATTFQVLGYSYLMPSTRVQALIQADVDQDATSIIKNISDCVIYDEAGNAFFNATNYTGGNNPANKEIYELNTSSTTQYTRKYAADEDRTIFDVNRGTQDNPMYIVGWNYNNSGRRKQVKTGAFYDLLPEGTTVDVDSIFGIPLTGNSSSSTDRSGQYDTYRNSSSRIADSLYDVRFITNWQESGRTMMVIRFTAPENVNATGMQFWYMLHNTYENVRENGTTVENDVAFVNTTEGAVQPFRLDGLQSTISQAYREYYDSLQTENEGYISYAKDSTNYIPVDAFSWGFVKTVKTDVDYEQSGVTIPNNEYTYRLTYTQSDYAESADIVFFDILEGGVYRDNQSLDSDWHGVLKSVDVSSAASKLTDGSDTVHCAPVVYYSTKDRGAFTGADYDLTNEATWTTERPKDASTITAIAVDCSKNEDGSDFVMKGLQVIDIYITMVAPTDEAHYGKTTYNEGVIYARKDNALESTPEYSDTAVTLENTDPVIHKASDPESGTEAAPARAYIDSELTYTLSVTNEDERFTLYDIFVEDEIPDGLNIDTSNIMVHFGDPSTAVRLSVSPRVSLEKSGQALDFTISSLQAGETIYLEIPTLVTGNDGDILENTSVITSVNGVEKSIQSETTWHEVKEEVVTEVSITKTGLGDGNPVVGATLVLENSSGEEVDRWVTDGEPHVITGLEPGDYILIEEEAPAGYLKASDMEITIQEIEETQEVDMKDDYTKVQVSKNDAENGPVAGASMELLDAEGKQVETWTTTTEPHTIYKLPAGDYVLREISAPAGYVKAADVSFTVREIGEVQAVEMIDAVTQVQISKVSAADGSAVVGAVLVIKNEDGEEYARWTTTGEPYLIKKIPVGKYTLVEESAPDGFLIADPVSFEVTETTELQKVEMADPLSTARITLKKVDADDLSIALEGVKFGIYSSEECKEADLVATITTGADGNATSEGLPLGTYYVKETQAKENYLISDTVYTVTLDESGKTVPVTEEPIRNKAVLGSIRLEKFGPDGKTPLQGVTFSLEDQNGKTQTLTTGADGSAVFEDLLPGEYTVTETKTAAGMTLLAEPITVTLPLVMTEAEAEASGADLTKGYLHSDGNYYFYNLTYRVTNNAVLDMPSSGGPGFPAAIGGAFLAAAGILLASTKRKKRRTA